MWPEGQYSLPPRKGLGSGQTKLIYRSVASTQTFPARIFVSRTYQKHSVSSPRQQNLSVGVRSAKLGRWRITSPTQIWVVVVVNRE